MHADWEARCDTISLRSPAVQAVTSTRSAFAPEWASLVTDQVAALEPVVAPPCWKQLGSVDPTGTVSSDAFCTRLPVSGSGGAGSGTTPPVASSGIVDVEQ